MVVIMIFTELMRKQSTPHSEISVYACGIRFKYFAQLEESILHAFRFFYHTVLNSFFFLS